MDILQRFYLNGFVAQIIIWVICQGTKALMLFSYLIYQCLLSMCTNVLGVVSSPEILPYLQV